ncbi:MAG: methionine synthase [Selenomonadaceae bacterium]|nr:methionine synthase [Selenomonadaceae bacterium]
MQIYNAPIFSIDQKETRRYAGLSRAENFSDELIAEACDDAKILITPRGVWEIYDYDCETQIVDNRIKLNGKSIGKHLATCEKLICLSATVGIEIETEITRRFSDGNYTSAILLDAAATSAIEQAADAVENSIKQKFSKDGFKTRWRFSPGYGDFPLEDQPQIFELSCASKIGICLTESMMLEPRKSITALVGLYRSSEKIMGQASRLCEICSKIDCYARRI